MGWGAGGAVQGAGLQVVEQTNFAKEDQPLMSPKGLSPPPQGVPGWVHLGTSHRVPAPHPHPPVPQRPRTQLAALPSGLDCSRTLRLLLRKQFWKALAPPPLRPAWPVLLAAGLFCCSNCRKPLHVLFTQAPPAPGPCPPRLALARHPVAPKGVAAGWLLP